MPNLARILYYLANAMKRVYWNRDKLRRYQEKRLRSVVKYAYDFVPFYHEKFRKAGVFPTDIKTLEDLNKLPIIKKDDWRHENSRRLVSTAFNMQKLKVVTTSGSTGKPFRVYLTRTEDDWRKAIYMRANISCGQKPRDRWVVITAPHHFFDTSDIQRSLGIFAQTVISVFADVDEQIRLVGEADPHVLDGYSQSLLLLAKEVERRRIETIEPRMIFGTAELIDEAARQFIERVFNAPFYDQFGCAEIDRSAWQCPEKVGYHMDVDSVITQFVDEDGEEVGPDERGEIVYSSLFNYAMPLIRYSVDDVGRSIDDECPCGRVLPLMKVVEGRKDAFVALPDGRVLPPTMVILTMIGFKRYPEIEQFRIVQKRLDHFKFIIKKKYDSVNENVMEKELVQHFMKILSVKEGAVDFDVEFVDDFPLNKSGKLMSVVSEVKFV